ncbi:type IV pilus assembly protein PilF [Nitrosomonas cryotolerans]|uniref:Type IV pilus assembly protein PilF n=1 Tax=Nitrosomonas cryotolerans ATCC 49181 TaxID=1131553 RepID=A0A1N6ITK5_9PROT|nr:type IV pilus biogenesis/stability protein PilW [Nitrosomonas cryotolerans]SFP32804.1 type IV pilus assembly protein PilF [Nitrosomonas cryotolerans]SIO35294.1 type IV pilus assembly protein PilF [Nitrosomonas cryotolerans ATCC 49181]
MRKLLSTFLALLAICWLSGCVPQSIQRGQLLEQSSSRARQSAKIHTELAAEYYNRGQLKVAMEEAADALQADPDYAPAYNVTGLIYMSLHKDILARNNFEHALKISPNDSEVHNNFGWFLCQRIPNKIDRAVEHFMMALNDPLYSTPEKSYTNAGICELKRDQYKTASVFFHKALSIQSMHSPALIGLIEVDLRSGDPVTAKSKLLRYMQHSALTPESLWLAIQIERKIGDRYAEDSYVFQLQKYFPDSKEAAALREGGLK